MKVLVEILRNVIELFLDDEFLAIAVLVVVALTALLILALDVQPDLAGGLLLFGTVAALIGSVLRTARQSTRR